MGTKFVLALLVLLVVPQQARAAVDSVLFVSTRADARGELYTVERDGANLQRVTFNDVSERQPVWSPDRSRIVFAGTRGSTFDIFTVAADGSDLENLTADGELENFPRWTSDGRVVFVRGSFLCPCRPWIVNADGTGLTELPLPGDVVMVEPSPRGQRLAYVVRRTDGTHALRASHLNGQGDKTIVEGNVSELRWSPNGNDIAFVWNTSGAVRDIWIVHSDGTGLRQLTDTPERIEGGPTWSSDGSEVLFGVGLQQSPVGELRAVSLRDGGESIVPTRPRAPFVDDFDDEVRDESIWNQSVTGTETSLRQANGRVEISIGAGAVPGGPFNAIDAQYSSRCQLPGDYDYQVDFDLLEWPAANGVQVALSAHPSLAFVWRQSMPFGESYVGLTSPTVGAHPTTDLSGTLRLVRSGGVASAMFWNGLQWATLASAPKVGSAVFSFQTSSFAFGGKAVRVAFDNFRLSSGELVCNWRDAWPDVY